MSDGDEPSGEKQPPGKNQLVASVGTEILQVFSVTAHLW